VQAAFGKHQAAATMQARHDAYHQVARAFRQTMSGAVDPTNPLDRKFMDDIAGAINRRERAEPAYDQEAAAYRSALTGFRGRIARWLSSQARSDAQAMVE
jgi:hypothetical protein